jgi:cytochrome c-type biogenesis protein CcmH/NrfF
MISAPLVKLSKEMSAEEAIRTGLITCGEWIRSCGVRLVCGIIVLALGTAVAALADRPLTAQEQQRANRLYTLFVAPCCWRQSVAVHQSAQGMHVRNEIDQDVLAGKSDTAIKVALIREYGHGILMDPEGMRGVLVYAVPVLACAIGLLLALRWIRRCVKVDGGSETSFNLTTEDLPDSWV